MDNLLRLLSLNAARIIFVGSLLGALFIGLNWALDIDARPDAASIAAAEASREAEASAAASEEASDVPPASPSDAPPTPTAVPETVDPQELIAAAAPPAETTVQVLDAGGGNGRVDSVVSVLEQIGYDIVARQSSSRNVERTTVYFTEGNQPEAEALRARDPRFQVVEGNRGLSEGVSIHVLVGPDF